MSDEIGNDLQGVRILRRIIKRKETLLCHPGYALNETHKKKKKKIVIIVLPEDQKTIYK